MQSIVYRNLFTLLIIQMTFVVVGGSGDPILEMQHAAQ
jgi:hypothetical protein